jgi:hypothetical protein
MNKETAELFEAWKQYQGERSDLSKEQFEIALIGEFSGYEELAEFVLEKSGLAEHFWEDKKDHSLARFFTFDYEDYGRCLDGEGDVYSIELQRSVYWFWTKV